MVSRPRFDTRQACSSASAISAMGYRFMSLQVEKLDQVASVRVASAALLRALSVHAWCEDKVPMVRVSDVGLKPAAAFVV